MTATSCGHAHARLAEGAQGAVAERVVQGEDGVELDPCLEQASHRRRAVLAMPGRGDPHQFRVVGDPGRIESFAVAPDAEVRRSDVLLVDGVGSDDRDAASADCDQVLDRRA